MEVLIFCHSILSDWNHGNAHFLRGVATELVSRGHRVLFCEDREAWSAANLIAEHGEQALAETASVYPRLEVVRYHKQSLDLERLADRADLVIVHEWSPRDLVRRIGELRKRYRSFRLFFHDTHHRAVTDPAAMAAYDLSGYDGVLAFGEALRQIYLTRGWSERVWTWHEAADTRVFRPIGPEARREAGDLIWIGNWGDGERTRELREFLIDPVRDLNLRARAYGVRYPEEARGILSEASIGYGGWIPNYRVPAVMAGYKATVHIPRRPYAEALPGIPTIRVFEALACGIPLVSAWADDVEGLFKPGRDFLTAANGAEAKRMLRAVIGDPAQRAFLAANGLKTILSRHTCRHRVDELLEIYGEMEGSKERSMQGAEGRGKKIMEAQS